MLNHLLAILGLGLLCGTWVAFQRWLSRVDPDGRQIESHRGGCGGQCRRPPATDHID